MAIDKKGKLTYVELLKEDLCIFRVVPEDGIIPDFKQILTLLILFFLFDPLPNFFKISGSKDSKPYTR